MAARAIKERDMKVMVMVKATTDSEAGTMPSTELLHALPARAALQVYVPRLSLYDIRFLCGIKNASAKRTAPIC